MDYRKPEKQPSKKWVNTICMHPGHKFPNMLVIPPGKSYTHTCPACGQKTTCRGSDVRWCSNQEVMS